jgi:hypothetical protein
MKIRTVPLQWYSDPGHSWLRVSRKDAERLNILERISAFSYQSESGRVLYLEEDCDAPILLDALSRSTDSLPNYRIDRHTNKSSRVRSLPSYRRIFYDVVCSQYGGLVETLDKLETYCRQYQPNYNVPRPCDQFPWNYDTFLEVLDNCTTWLKENTGQYVYWTIGKDLIVTSDIGRCHLEISEKHRTLRLANQGK